MGDTVRVPVYIHKTILKAIRETYPEARSDGEAIQLFIYETLAGTIETRSFDSEAIDLAEALVKLKKSKLRT